MFHSYSRKVRALIMKVLLAENHEAFDLDPAEACKVLLGSPIPVFGSRKAAEKSWNDTEERLNRWVNGTLDDAATGIVQSGVKPWFNIDTVTVTDFDLKVAMVVRLVEGLLNAKLFSLLWSKNPLRQELILLVGL